MTTFALASPDRPKEVLLWCRGIGRRKNGTQRFTVINGEWEGLLGNGEVLVVETQMRFPAVEVWRGKVPNDMNSSDYNEAIAWIEKQITDRESEA